MIFSYSLTAILLRNGLQYSRPAPILLNNPEPTQSTYKGIARNYLPTPVNNVGHSTRWGRNFNDKVIESVSRSDDSGAI